MSILIYTPRGPVFGIPGSDWSLNTERNLSYSQASFGSTPGSAGETVLTVGIVVPTQHVDLLNINDVQQFREFHVFVPEMDGDAVVPETARSYHVFIEQALDIDVSAVPIERDGASEVTVSVYTQPDDFTIEETDSIESLL